MERKKTERSGRLREKKARSHEAERQLIHEAPPVVKKNWNARPYFQFARESKPADSVGFGECSRVYTPTIRIFLSSENCAHWITNW